MKAIFASRNAHKAEQVQRLLVGLELVPLDEAAPGLDLEEPFDSFEANALAKARAVVKATGAPAVGDDSGLEVDALNGAPGVLSARFAGEGAADSDNNAKLVEALRGVDEADRTARYRCVAVLVLPDGREFVAEGSCEGTITPDGRGALGFGYDPHFIPVLPGGAPETRTMGEIPLDEKLAFSHRGRAFRALAAQLRRDAFILDPEDSTAPP
ncbi:MAG: non-canonical purine NTP pyrophosphatase [Actinomycetota bacterium]